MRKLLLKAVFLSALLATTIASLTTAAATPDVGQHIHVTISNHPVDGVSLPRAKYTFNVTLTLHNYPVGKITSFRVSDYSDVKKTVYDFSPNVSGNQTLGPCADCSISFPFEVDFSSWSCGRHELRWTANVPDNNEGKRQFTTSRSHVLLSGCTTNRSGRPNPLNGGGSWYEGRDYNIVFMQSPETNIRPGGSFYMRAQANATAACAFLSPNFHNNSRGTQLGCWTGQSLHKVDIPSTALIGSKLAMYATDGKQAGLFVMQIGNGTAQRTAVYEWQSWWAAGGIVLP